MTSRFFNGCTEGGPLSYLKVSHLTHIQMGFIIIYIVKVQWNLSHKNKDYGMKENQFTYLGGCIYSEARLIYWSHPLYQTAWNFAWDLWQSPVHKIGCVPSSPMPLLLDRHSAPSDWHRGQLYEKWDGNVRLELGAHCENHLSSTMEFPSTNTAPSRFSLLPPTVNSSGPMKQVKLFRPNLPSV